MSYVLINGKRYYKDDRTGRITLDNVSQAEADRRAQRNQGVVRFSGTDPSSSQAGNSRTAASAVSVVRHTGFPWKAAIAFALIALFSGAFVYNHSHVSSEEQAITDYMNAQETNAATMSVADDQADEENTAEESASSESSGTASYLMADSAERYLEAGDIKNYSHDEIQLIINEIYARHGREFNLQENIDYFSAQDWYEPVPGKSDEEIVSEFNEYEKANVELLCEYL